MKKSSTIDKKVLHWIENRWINADLSESNEDKWKEMGKLLRLLVNHVKTSEGIPKGHQENIKQKADYLLSSLPCMSVKDGATCVSAIDHARSYLETTSEYGSGLRAGLSDSDRAKLRETNRPIDLSPEGP